VCVLLVSWRQRSDFPLVLAANRDEAYARPARRPEVVRAGNTWALAPRDLTAGGTWIGVAATGLVVAITNRRDGDFDAARPSRGHLCRLALEQPDAAAVQRFLVAETGARAYNSFNLLHADRDRAWVTSWNGTLQSTELRPGVAVLSNEHALGEVVSPGLAVLQDAGGALAELREALQSFAARHEPEPESGLVICKHGATHGTVSSSLVFVPASAAAWIEYAAGPPCCTGFAIHTLHSTGRVP